MFEVTIRIPEADNDGNPFPREMLRDLAQRIAETFGGYELRGRSEGRWVEAGQLFIDRNTVIAIWLDSFRQVAAFIDLADHVRVTFRQLAIGVTVAGIPEVLSG